MTVVAVGKKKTLKNDLIYISTKLLTSLVIHNSRNTTHYFYKHNATITLNIQYFSLSQLMNGVKINH